MFHVHVILQNLRPSGVLFSKETVCEKFQIAREKVVVTVTTVTYRVAPVAFKIRAIVMLEIEAFIAIIIN